MVSTGLPAEIQAEWIWKTQTTDEIESYVFFRREFTLDETPRSAELWITAGTFFHLYVNGRHFYYGPSPALGNQFYVEYIDVGFCLEIGRNVITVLVHNLNLARSAQMRKKSGLWCQLNIDGNPTILSDESWSWYDPDCYQKNQPRLSKLSGLVESVDLRKYPTGWKDLDYQADKWKLVANSTPVDGSRVLVPSQSVEKISEKVPFDILLYQGQTKLDKAIFQIFFPPAFKNNCTGLFVAETFVNFQEPSRDFLFYLISDDPYYLFINNTLVKKQGGGTVSAWSDPMLNPPHCYQQDEMAPMEGRFPLTEGWNRILIYQYVDLNSSSMTLIFPELEEREIKFVKTQSAFGLPGWNFAGPLTMPFNHASGSLSMTNLPQSTFHAIHPHDISAYLLAYTYEDNPILNLPQDSVELKSGEYAIFEIEKYTRGCVDMILNGRNGDTVDLVYGGYLKGNVLLPLDRGVRRLYSITLNDGVNHWQAVTPHGMKYVMIVVRNAAGVVSIEDIGIRKINYIYKDQNIFVCSDELLNQVWERGVITLNATCDHIFLSSSGNDGGQLLADAMIQSLTSFYIMGNHTMGEKALREFANAQYETGEIPAVAPSDLYLRYLDYTMLWPVWLYHHVLYTGNHQIVKEFMPNLERLIAFLEASANPQSKLLENLLPPYHNYCLIDYDRFIDRRGISTGLNAIYCYSLAKTEALFSMAGNTELSQKCAKLAGEIAVNIRNLTWNKDKGLFADSWLNDKLSDSCSLQTNILLLNSNIALPEQFEAVFNHFFLDYAPFHEPIKDGENDNPYFKFFLLEMAFNLGLREWGIEYMRYYWGKMVQLGASTWWDKFNPDMEFGPENATSICHGYASFPNYYLIREVIGLQSAVPGSSKIFFNPVLTACEWAKAKIRTPQGNIRAEWSHLESGELEIRIDADFPLEVIPKLDPNIAAKAIVHISDNVNIVEG